MKCDTFETIINILFLLVVILTVIIFVGWLLGVHIGFDDGSHFGIYSNTFEPCVARWGLFGACG
jgi:hypothetical protein